MSKYRYCYRPVGFYEEPGQPLEFPTLMDARRFLRSFMAINDLPHNLRFDILCYLQERGLIDYSQMLRTIIIVRVGVHVDNPENVTTKVYCFKGMPD